MANFFGVAPDVILEWPGNQIDLTAASQGDPQIEKGAWLIVPGSKRELRDWGHLPSRVITRLQQRITAPDTAAKSMKVRSAAAISSGRRSHPTSRDIITALLFIQVLTSPEGKELQSIQPIAALWFFPAGVNTVLAT